MNSFVAFYPCRDIEETKTFYTNVLHFPIWHEQYKAVIFDTGYGYLGFAQYDDKPLATSVIISFNCQDEVEVDAMYKRFYEMDEIHLLSYPKRQDGFDVYSFFIEDPNGYQLEFQKILGL